MNFLRYLLKLAKEAFFFAACGVVCLPPILVLMSVSAAWRPRRYLYPLIVRAMVSGHNPFGPLGWVVLVALGIAFGLAIWLAFRLIWSLVKQPDPLLSRKAT
jgi:hypothetical protein